MDGTLVNSMPYWHRLGAEYLVSQGIAPPHDLSTRLETMTLMEAADYFISELGVLFGKDDIIRQLNAMIEGHYRCDIPLKPYAKAYLQTLHEQGVRMCVATASSEELCQSCFARLGILPTLRAFTAAKPWALASIRRRFFYRQPETLAPRLCKLPCMKTRCMLPKPPGRRFLCSGRVRRKRQSAPAGAQKSLRPLYKKLCRTFVAIPKLPFPFGV